MNIKYELPKLYILSNNKKRFWHIWIEETLDKKIYIHRNYGILTGKITVPSPKIANSFEKAKTEVNALWRKKKESGFHEEHIITKSKSSTIKPMSAYKLEDHYHKIKYPALVQRKLDGFRCMSHIKNNNAILYSKGMKTFTFLHHIKKEIEKITELLNNENIYLDGELYSYGLPLHKISSLVMKKYASKENEKNMEKMEYHIFDIFNVLDLSVPFKKRFELLKHIFKKHKFNYLKIVDCIPANSYEEIQKLDIQFLFEGYEGVIVRNEDGIYKLNSKSYDVLRTKEFKKKEFIIIGAKEGTGTQHGAIVWQMQCLNNSKSSFYAIPIGTIEERRKIFKDYKQNSNKYIGKNARVKFLEITSDGCISRNPIVEEIFIN